MKFKVTINVSGENHVLFTMAKNDRDAIKHTTNRLAKQLNRTAQSIRMIVYYEPNSYSVEQV